MSTQKILIWTGVAVVGYLVYKKFTAPAPNKTANPITASTQGRGNSAGTPAQNNSGTDLSAVAGAINSTAGAFESTINTIGGALGLGSSQTGTNQTAGN